MPYILEKDRKSLQKHVDVDRVCDYFSIMSLREFAGNLNYLITRIVNRFVKVDGKKYFTFAVIVGTLICCVLEIYRKRVVPYEEIKEKENGSVD